MNLIADTIAWIAEHFASGELWLRIGEHLFYTVISVLIAAAIAIPVGYWIGHTGKGREIAVGISGAARALPSFGLILLLIGLVGVVQRPIAAFAAFVILAIPSILAGAYSGIQAIDRTTIDAARAVGMTEWQILWKVEAPLGLHLLVGGTARAARCRWSRPSRSPPTSTSAGSATTSCRASRCVATSRCSAPRSSSSRSRSSSTRLFGALTHVVDRIIPASTPASRPKKTRALPLRQPALPVGTPTST